MSINSQCKQCYYYQTCIDNMPQEYPNGVFRSIREKRAIMTSLMMDCFKSPEQYKRDIESALKSQANLKKRGK